MHQRSIRSRYGRLSLKCGPDRHLDVNFVRHHDVIMRTTLTLEDDVAEQLAQLAKKTDQPFKVVVNKTLRRGLADLSPALPVFEYQSHLGGLLPGIDDRRLNELAWQLDEERHKP